MNWELCCFSDLRHAGTNEFGEALTKEVFYLVLENERGDRYASCREAGSAEALDGFQANVLRALKNGASPVGSAKWYRRQPAYCSEAYIEYGAAMEIEAERRND